MGLHHWVDLSLLLFHDKVKVGLELLLLSHQICHQVLSLHLLIVVLGRRHRFLPTYRPLRLFPFGRCTA